MSTSCFILSFIFKFIFKFQIKQSEQAVISLKAADQAKKINVLFPETSQYFLGSVVFLFFFEQKILSIGKA